MKKGAHSGAPPFTSTPPRRLARWGPRMANGGCYLFFAAFFFPPLAFFAIL